MKNLTYLFAGYMVIWGLIAFYMFGLNNKIKDLYKKIEQLTESE